MTETFLGTPKTYPDWLIERRGEQEYRIMPQFSRPFEESDEPADGFVRDVAFNRHSMNDGDHVSPSDNAKMQVATDGIRVALAQGIDVDALKKTLTAATRATIGLDMTQALPGEWEPCPHAGEVCQMGHLKHRESPGMALPYQGQVPMDDWEEMLKGGLQTALETQTIVFAVGGVSRTCTHQLVRTRKASFHQQSQRAGYMGDCPEVRIPDSIWRVPEARFEFLRATMACWRAYRRICEFDVSYQDARFVLQEGTTNFILLEYPIREFLNLFAYRGCFMFQWEIVHVMHECRRLLVEEYPWLEPYIKISCEKTGPAVIQEERTELPLVWGGPTRQVPSETVEHHCTFQGWEDVEGQCPFSWARHEARTFKPAFHRISRKV